MKRILVAGGGGFIGGHLVQSLLNQGNSVRVADVKPLNLWYQLHPTAENHVLDLSLLDSCRMATRDVDEIYNLAADMGGWVL